MPNSRRLKLCTTKQMKYKEGEDRISNLPKSIIHHIFSFLDMKDVIQTNILSRTWRYLWTSLPVLNFDCEVFYTKKTTRAEEGFKEFVDQVFILRDRTNIQRFNLCCYNRCDYIRMHNRLYTWIITAIRRDIQELYLDIACTYAFQFPDCFFTCKSLTIMELNSSEVHLELKLPDSMSLPRLKTLVLRMVEIDGDDIPKIFSSCPVLESLTIIQGEFNHKNLDISSLTLKHLVMEYCEMDTGNEIDVDQYGIKLCAPSLISFRCRDYMWKNYSLDNLSSLVKVDIDQHVEDTKCGDEVKNFFAERMIKILRGLYNVEVLTLSAWFVEVVTRAPVLLESSQIQLCNLRSLKLETWLSRNCVESITYLLKISPNIESLFLIINKDVYRLHPVYAYWDEVWFNSAKIEAYWESGESVQCVLHHLKSVEIRGIRGYVNELILLESLLKNAMVLEKLVLFTSKEESPHTESRFLKFTEKLLTFPKASSSAAVFLF